MLHPDRRRISATEIQSLDKLNKKIVDCKLCLRLSKYIKEVGERKIRKFNDQLYWAKPVPTFGDPKAKLLIIGLAPAAHGGNRTGRIFTGDSSGDWLIKALYQTGFANKSTSVAKNDGLVLRGAYLTAAVMCAPPNNRPNFSEISNCSQYLSSEIELLNSTTKVIVTLGRIAFDSYCKIFGIKGLKFGHNMLYTVNENKTLIASYHPSRRNTNTGTLTWQMWISIFEVARSIIDHQKE